MEEDGPCSRDDVTGQRTSTEDGWIMRMGLEMQKESIWLGLNKISCLTSVGVPKLRVDLIDFAGQSMFACYDYFHVGTPSTNYKLTIGGYQHWGLGTAGDMVACRFPLMTETMTSTVAITVQCTIKERGGTTGVPTQTSMGCTSMARVITVVSHGCISMPLHQVGSHFDTQT